MASRLCVNCADCLAPKNFNDPQLAGKYRCGHSSAVGAHHPVAGEAPRPFGVDLVNAPSCEDMRKDSLVFETCGTDGNWFRNTDQKEDQEAARDAARHKAQVAKDAADKQAALVSTGTAA